MMSLIEGQKYDRKAVQEYVGERESKGERVSSNLCIPKEHNYLATLSALKLI